MINGKKSYTYTVKQTAAWNYEGNKLELAV